MKFLDTETVNFGVGSKLPPLVCLQMSDEGDAEIFHRSDTWQQPALDALSQGVGGFNVAYDLGVLVREEPSLIPHVFEAYEQDRVSDVMLREQLLDNAEGLLRLNLNRKGYYGLAQTAKRRAGWDLEKGSVQVRFGELYDVPLKDWPAAFRNYARADVLATRDSHHAQGTHPNLVDEHRQARAGWWIQLMSAWGIATDPIQVAKMKAQITAERDGLFWGLVAGGLVRRDGSRDMAVTKGMIERGYLALGVPAPRTDPSTRHPAGQIATDRETCENAEVPLLEDYCRFTQLSALLDKDIAAFEAPLIHSFFKVLVETGRTSSSKPNLQNLPRMKGMRECFVPRPGKAFVILDYSGLELATLAQACLTLLGKSKLAEVLNSGVDPHLMMAARILGRTYDECKAIRKAGKDHPLYSLVDNARQTGKAANFGFPGGLGAKTLRRSAQKSYGVILTQPQSVQLKADWLMLWPEMPEYFRHVNALIELSSGPPKVEQLFSGRVRGDVDYCPACNTYFQGLGADMAKDAGFRLCREMYNPVLRSVLYGSRIVNFVHDEFVIECPIEGVHEVAIRADELMTEAARTWLPDVKCGTEYFASMRYTKGGQATYDRGRLVVS